MYSSYESQHHHNHYQQYQVEGWSRNCRPYNTEAWKSDDYRKPSEYYNGWVSFTFVGRSENTSSLPYLDISSFFCVSAY